MPRSGRQTEPRSSYNFLFHSVFDHPVEGREGGESVPRLRQGDRTASEFALEFRSIVASTGWNELSLVTVFRSGLRKEVQLELACHDDNLSLDQLISIGQPPTVTK